MNGRTPPNPQKGHDSTDIEEKGKSEAEQLADKAKRIGESHKAYKHFRREAFCERIFYGTDIKHGSYPSPGLFYHFCEKKGAVPSAIREAVFGNDKSECEDAIYALYNRCMKRKT